MAGRAYISAQGNRLLVLACGAIAKELVRLKLMLGVEFDLQCLPAGYHNTPQNIVPDMRAILDARGDDYDRILIGYGDCGTGGGLDRLLENYPKATRLPGAHCYAFFAGLPEFDAMMEEELGSFFLTDYLALHFETLIWKGMGLDCYPDLLGMYFANYKRVVYLAQTDDAAITAKAKAAADKLGLDFERRDTGYGLLYDDLKTFIESPKGEPAHV